MSSVNKAIILGRVGKDPEVRYAQNGSAVCNLSMATSRKWKDKQSGETKEETEWHRVVLYERRAEVAGEYLKKGGLVYIEGRLKTRKWTDKDGIERYTTEIQGDEMKLLGGRGDSDGGGESAPAKRTAAPAPAQRQQPAARQDDGGVFDDDIPF